MDSEDDDGLTFKASGSLLQDLETALPKILWKQRGGRARKVHRYVKRRPLSHILGLLEPFQSEPQLLDVKLKLLITPLIDAYLEYLSSHAGTPRRDLHYRLDEAISVLLYDFCKIRGEKIIAGFFPNEPRHLELVLKSLEVAATCSDQDPIAGWRNSHVLTLWLWHLTLAPFDLSTVSTVQLQASLPQGIELPKESPPVISRIIARGLHSLAAVIREQQAAAKLMTRLVNRPDFQRLAIHEAILPYTIARAIEGFAAQHTEQATLGYLRFLVGIAATCTGNRNVQYLPMLWQAGQTLADRLFGNTQDSSAINRKLVIKLLRNIAVAAMTSASAEVQSWADDAAVLEETIDRFLQALDDKDTDVRFAVAKALGIIIARLDSEMAEQVIETLVTSYDYDPQDAYDFSFHEPQKWHGLTLSLAHCLFGRSVGPHMLPSVLSVLIPALNFEKRAVTGNSLGTNVRDAACFAIWSTSRRYTTAELLAVPTDAIGGLRTSANNIIQYLAIQLLGAACLDPHGNVRRGCSAALQEMVGRHPDQVSHGIALIQIVDYLAVGLRRRAMVDLVQQASALDTAYWRALLTEMQGWRGIGSPDLLSRQAAAESIGKLCIAGDIEVVERTIHSLSAATALHGEAHNDIRHGALLALCEIAEQTMQQPPELEGRSRILTAVFVQLCLLSHHISELEYSPRAVRAEYPAAVSRYCTAIFCLHEILDEHPSSFGETLVSLTTILQQLQERSDESLLLTLPKLVQAVHAIQANGNHNGQLLDTPSIRTALAMDGRRLVVHGAARAFALAASVPFSTPDEAAETITCIYDLMAAQVIEWRVLALRALTLIVQTSTSASPSTIDRIVQHIKQAAIAGLTDYTITERGDVGSLARYQALVLAQELWARQQAADDGESSRVIQCNVLKLALEKLDKVRLKAREALSVLQPDHFPATEDVSSYGYFCHMLRDVGTQNMDPDQGVALLRGLCSSAGTGAEHLLQAARSALSDTLTNTEQAPHAVVTTLSGILGDLTSRGEDTVPILELLAFVLDYSNLTSSNSDIKWRLLLSRVQKAHFKSIVAPRLLAAIDVYRSLGRVPDIRSEVVKKLESMVKTNPLPRVRYASAETLWYLTGNEQLLAADFSRSGKENAAVLSDISEAAAVAAAS